MKFKNPKTLSTEQMNRNSNKRHHLCAAEAFRTENMFFLKSVESDANQWNEDIRIHVQMYVRTARQIYMHEIVVVILCRNVIACAIR